MLFTDWTGLSGLALVWMLLALRLSARFSLPKQRLLAVAVYFAVMLPVSGLSLAGWLRGMVGDLSISSVLLLGAALYARLRPDAQAIWDARERYGLLFLLGVLALVLYPFALGIGMSDPYRSGFGGIGFIMMLALLAFWTLRRNLKLLPLAIALALLAWTVGWYESSNLWDYLIDAPLAIYALFMSIKLLLLNVRRGKRAWIKPQ
ncbi:MAG: hypothetical protein PHQ60_15260 [Sideroxydans sp.]|nr:hypothetical protein [Sideroxydans sp.]